MDYEQKYKDALERAKNLIALYPQDAPGYREVFPELAESEDERIRKQLIDAIKIGRSNSGISFTEEAASRYIAWLEKHSEEEIRKIRKEEYTNGFNDAAGFGKQKEQKPAEWSEEDEFSKILNLVYKAIRKVLANFRVYSEDEELLDSREESIDYYSQRCAEEILKSLRLSWKPSEEQMNRLFSIVAALRKDYCDDMADFLANLYADLKKLGVKEEPEYYQHFDPDC